MFEVVISSHSPLLNKKVKESSFRSKYNAAIFAINRKNTQITSGIGNIVLKTGDILLLLTKEDFFNTWKDSEDFFVISPIKVSNKTTRSGKIMVIGILLGFIISFAFQLLSIFQLSLLTAAMILVTHLLSVSEAKRAINWNIIILMACSIGVGEAIEKTGLAQIIASFITPLHSSVGVLGIVFTYYVITMVMTEILNNLATAALMFPIGIPFRNSLHLEPIMFAMITAIAASFSFLTPIGYQTNLLVYGPGGYKFTDYIKSWIPP